MNEIMFMNNIIPSTYLYDFQNENIKGVRSRKQQKVSTFC